MLAANSEDFREGLDVSSLRLISGSFARKNRSPPPHRVLECLSSSSGLRGANQALFDEEWQERTRNP